MTMTPIDERQRYIISFIWQKIHTVTETQYVFRHDLIPEKVALKKLITMLIPDTWLHFHD